MVMLQREMISSHLTLERFTPSPRVLDVDDAIHLLRGGDFARKLAQISDRVIAGNSYLAEWYSAWNRDVVILPTAVDADRYVPAPAVGRDMIVIGWIGTSANFGYLETLAPALARVVAEHPHVHIKIVSDRAPAFSALAPDRWSFVKWGEASEISDIQSMDIGIMPLADSPWARGKCSFKMLQYMACGLPVVVSPVGMGRGA
jgi:glycosyltransferase involved in cell wall biosynthesis